MKNRTAAIFMTEMRPILSAIVPAVIAPAAAPISADATAKPSSALPIPKSSWIGVDRPVDDRAVVAEQQATERRHRGDSDGGATRGEVVVGDDRVRVVDWGTLTGHETTFPQRCVIRVTFKHS